MTQNGIELAHLKKDQTNSISLVRINLCFLFWLNFCRASTPWLLNVVPVSVVSTQTPATPTWYDTNSNDIRCGFSSNLATTEGDVFMATSYTATLTNNIRLFSRTGTLNLLYNSGWTGQD